MVDRYCQSYAVKRPRAKVPDLIEYMYARALMLEATLKVSPMSPWARDKAWDEWSRRVATLMTLDWYSATHPFDKEDVDLEPTYVNPDQLDSWWRRYHNLGPKEVVERIWAEVDL